MRDKEPETQQRPALTLWDELTVGFPKRRHVYVYRLPLAVTLFCTAAVFLLAGSTLTGTPTSGSLSAVLAGSLAAYFWILHRKTKRCWSLDQAVQSTGMTRPDLERIISERAIRPEFVVDGTPVYEPADLTEAAILLRPAGDTGDDKLLRGAAGQRRESATLVRATDVAEPELLANPEPQPAQLEQRT